MLYVTLARPDQVGFGDIAAVRWKDRTDYQPLSILYGGGESRNLRRTETIDEYLARQAGRGARQVPDWVVSKLLSVGRNLEGKRARDVYAKLAATAFDATIKEEPTVPAKESAGIDSTRMTAAEFEQHMKRKFQKAWDTW